MPGREEYASGDEGAREWEEAILQFQQDNFEEEGVQVRTMDQRDCKVGLFGDFLERMGHGKFVEWRPDAENGGLYKLEVVTKVRADCLACVRQLAFEWVLVPGRWLRTSTAQRVRCRACRHGTW